MAIFQPNSTAGISTAGLWPEGGGNLFAAGFVVTMTATQFTVFNQFTGTYARYTGSGFAYNTSSVPGFVLLTGGTYSQVEIVDSTDTTVFATLSGFTSQPLVDIGAAGTPALVMAGADVLVGAAGVDTLAGSGGGDTFNGGGSTDFQTGGAGNDVFVYLAPSEIASDVINGGADTDTIRIGAVGPAAGGTYDFQLATLTSIEAIDFNNTGGAAAEIVLTAAQVNTGIVSFNGGNGTDTLTINMGSTTSFDLGFVFYQFTNWSAGNHVVINGDGDGETITGSQQADTLNGGAGNDVLKGQGGVDSINGGPGSDTILYDINGPVAGEVIDGGADQDTLKLEIQQTTYDFRSVSITSIETMALTAFGHAVPPGDPQGSTISFAYFLAGQVGTGLAQNLQIVIGENTLAMVTFETGAVTTFDISGFSYSGSLSPIGLTTVDIIGDGDAETLTGEDVGAFGVTFLIEAGGGDDSVATGDAGATVFAGTGHDLVLGFQGNDTLIGNADIFAQESDTLAGAGGDDTLYGEFTDTVSGGTGHDVLYAVNDFAWSIDLGATSIEYMQAGFGNDIIAAATQTAAVEIFASGGADTLTGSAFDDFLWAGVGNDTVNGGEGADMLFGDAGVDSLSGGGGNDRIYADGDDTTVNGGAGFDAVYIASGSGVFFDMAAQGIEWVADLAGAGDILDGNALTVDMTAYGGGGNDGITGGSGNDFLWGEAGDDTIIGGLGGDVLVGGIGGDILVGGGGTDVIYLNSGGGSDGAQDQVLYLTAGWGTDFVFDFVHGEDKINLSLVGTSFAALNITNTDGHAYIHIGTGADLIAVANNGGLLTSGDFLF